MAMTKIDWCNRVWNPITGCSPVSEGCRNCYAQRMANRLKGRYGYPKDDPFRVTFHPERLEEPLHWKKPSKIFVCSMGDLFHEDVDSYWHVKIMQIIRKCPYHIFLFLTKRPEKMKDILFHWFVPNIPNLWLGVSVEDQSTADKRIPILLQIPAAKRFVSCEPLLNSIDIKSYLPGTVWGGFRENPSTVKIILGIDWLIVGGETGPGARPLNPDWIRSLRDQCQTVGMPFFFKNWGSNSFEMCPDYHKRRNWPDHKIKLRGHFLDGEKYREFPKEIFG